MQARRGVTRADVLALGAVLVVLGLLIPPLLAQARNEKDNRAACAKNLRLIAQSMAVYSNENSDLHLCIGGTSAVTCDILSKDNI